MMDRLTIDLAADVDRAFPALVTRFQDGLFSGVRRLVPQHVDAEDICAEAFLRAYRALSTMTPAQVKGIDVAPWLWTIALNLARNAARRRSRKPWVSLEGDRPIGSRGPEAETVGRAHLEELVRSLPTGQRTAVVLRFVVGLTYAEIAAATGRPEGSIKSDVSRGLDRLRRVEVT
jgi:RNA polymerase sigma-70 factor (ECF subfamily)